MNEAEWLTCGSRVHMRRVLKGNCQHLPFRWVRFDLACCDRVRELINDDRCFYFLNEMEQHAADRHRNLFRSFHREQTAVREAIRNLWRQRIDPLRHARIAAARAVLAVSSHSFATSEMVAVAVGRWRYGVREERRAHCTLIRDIFGNPFRPVTFAPEWRTDTAVAIASQMYDSRDFSAMPILADALQDAGCDSDDILSHCREEGATHVRGCWVVDLVLGKD